MRKPAAKLESLEIYMGQYIVILSEQYWGIKFIVT